MPKFKLFILEDDLVTAAMYDHYFNSDFQVTIASSVNSFHQYFNEHTPDVAIIDINIKDPDFDGEKLVYDLRTKQNNDKTKFIAVTGYHELKSSQYFDAHYAKPIDLDRLGRFINSQFVLKE